MTALTVDRNTHMKDKDLVALPMAANTKIFMGSLVAISLTGFAMPGAVSPSLVYAGRAEQYMDNTGGADGAQTVLVRRNKIFKWANLGTDAVVQANVGKRCYIVDDNTIAATSANGTRSPAGIVDSIDADGVWVSDQSSTSPSASAALTFPAINPASSNDQVIPVPGASVGDSVELGLPAAPTLGFIFEAFVSAADTVTVRATNITAGALTPTVAAIYRATVHKA